MTLLILLVFLTSGLSAHSVIHAELRDGYGIQVSYEGSDPLEFSDVQVFRPGETENEFQVGMTDLNGVFMFKPDTSGVWTLKVSDGLGHGKVIEVTVDAIAPTLIHERGNFRIQKIISGIGYIFFIFSLWYFIAKRRKS